MIEIGPPWSGIVFFIFVMVLIRGVIAFAGDVKWFVTKVRHR